MIYSAADISRHRKIGYSTVKRKARLCFGTVIGLEKGKNEYGCITWQAPSEVWDQVLVAQKIRSAPRLRNTEPKPKKATEEQEEIVIFAPSQYKPVQWSKMHVVLKGCARCKGDLMPDTWDCTTLKCVQCGHSPIAVA